MGHHEHGNRGTGEPGPARGDHGLTGQGDPAGAARFMAERANATIVEVPASHVSFVSLPEAATQLIFAVHETTGAST
jgi:hypothetical protein